MPAQDLLRWALQLELRIQYAGLFRTQLHMSWWCNIIDRAAVVKVAESGSPLFVEGLSTHIEKLFAEELEDKVDEEEVDGDDNDQCDEEEEEGSE